MKRVIYLGREPLTPLHLPSGQVHVANGDTVELKTPADELVLKNPVFAGRFRETDAPVTRRQVTPPPPAQPAGQGEPAGPPKPQTFVDDPTPDGLTVGAPGKGTPPAKKAAKKIAKKVAKVTKKKRTKKPITRK